MRPMPRWFSLRSGANSRASAPGGGFPRAGKRRYFVTLPVSSPPQPVPAMPIEHLRCSQGAGQDSWTSDGEAHVCFAVWALGTPVTGSQHISD